MDANEHTGAVVIKDMRRDFTTFFVSLSPLFFLIWSLFTYT